MTWKFLGQVSNLHHRSHLSHCRDNAGSLTHCTTRELQKSTFVQKTALKDVGITGICFPLKLKVF